MERALHFPHPPVCVWNYSYERTPMDEAVSQGKMEVVDAINAAVAEFELNGVEVS